MAGSVIAVWSPKGGVGKTLIAAALSVHLATEIAGEVLLVDLDAGKADLAPLLQSSPRPSILDYPSATGPVPKHPTGAHILSGPARLVDEGLVTGELAQAVLDKATAEGYTVVADLDADLRDSTVVTLERADAVLLITTPDLLSLYPIRRFTQEAKLIHLDLAKFRLIINRSTPRQEVSEAQILMLAGVPLAGRVPSQPELASAVNRGKIATALHESPILKAAMTAISRNLAFAGVPTQITGSSHSTPTLFPALRRWWIGQ